MTLDMTWNKEKKAQAKKKLTERQLLEAKGYVFDDEEHYVTTPKGNKFPLGKRGIAVKGQRFFVSTGLSRIQRIMNQFPEVDKWLRTRYTSTGTWEHYGCSLIDFCIAKDITPKEFAELRHNDKEQDQAIELASEYLQELIFKKKYNRAIGATKAFKSFYEFHSKGRKLLALDTKGSLNIKIEFLRSKEKPRYAWGPPKEIRRKVALIIPAARDLFDRMALTFLYRTGCRDNVLTHLKIKHVQDRFELEDPLTSRKEEVLCLTITGYNRETKEGLCEKTEHYNFPTLLDDPEQRHGYYTFLAKDSLKLFDQFLEKYHPDPKPDDYVFFRFSDRQKPLIIHNLTARFRTILTRLEFPSKKIWLHQFKELTTNVAKAALSKAESYHAEFITGHLLDQVKEHYHKRNKIANGQAYLKIDFGASISQKEEEIEALKKQVETSRKQVRKYEEAIEKAEATTKIEIEPLGPAATRNQIQNAFKDFNEALEEQTTPQPTKTEARSPTKPLSKPLIVKDQVEQPKETQKPKATSYSSFASLREKPQSTDQQLNRICLKRLRVFGVGRQIACRNCKKRDPSQYAACLEIQREQLGLS